jgi:hypothetical protein
MVSSRRQMPLQAQRLLAVRGDRHGEALALQQQLHRASHVGVVVDDKHPLVSLVHAGLHEARDKNLIYREKGVKPSALRR